MGGGDGEKVSSTNTTTMFTTQAGKSGGGSHIQAAPPSDTSGAPNKTSGSLSPYKQSQQERILFGSTPEDIQQLAEIREACHNKSEVECLAILKTKQKKILKDIESIRTLYAPLKDTYLDSLQQHKQKLANAQNATEAQDLEGIDPWNIATAEPIATAELPKDLKAIRAVLQSQNDAILALNKYLAKVDHMMLHLNTIPR